MPNTEQWIKKLETIRDGLHNQSDGGKFTDEGSRCRKIAFELFGEAQFKNNDADGSKKNVVASFNNLIKLLNNKETPDEELFDARKEVKTQVREINGSAGRHYIHMRHHMTFNYMLEAACAQYFKERDKENDTSKFQWPNFTQGAIGVGGLVVTGTAIFYLKKLFSTPTSLSSTPVNGVERIEYHAESGPGDMEIALMICIAVALLVATACVAHGYASQDKEEDKNLKSRLNQDSKSFSHSEANITKQSVSDNVSQAQSNRDYKTPSKHKGDNGKNNHYF